MLKKKIPKNIDLNNDLNRDDFDEVIIEELGDGSKRVKTFKLNKYESNEIKKNNFMLITMMKKGRMKMN